MEKNTSSFTRDEILDTEASFTWFFGEDWLVETHLGNFHWKDPDHGDGDNTLTPFAGSYDQFRIKVGIQYGRDKGRQTIRNMCGEDVKLNLQPVSA